MGAIFWTLLIQRALNQSMFDLALYLFMKEPCFFHIQLRLLLNQDSSL